MRAFIFLFPTLIFTIVLTSGFSQAYKKPTLALAPFTFSSVTASQDNATSAYNQVLNAFVNSKRFTVLDRMQRSVIGIERNIQTNDDFINSEVVKRGKSLGAQFLVFGHIDAIPVSYSESRNTTTNIVSRTYNSTISISIRIYDVETEQVIYSFAIMSNAKGGGTLGSINIFKKDPCTGNSEVEAVSNCTAEIFRLTMEYVRDNFFIDTPIFRIQQDGKKVIAYIVRDEGINLKTGEEFEAFLREPVKMPNGSTKYIETVVGTIKVERVGTDFFECNGKKNSDAILAQFTGGKTLFIKQ